MRHDERVPPPRTPLAYHVLPKRHFYGWYIALGASVMTMVTVGVGYYGLAVFLSPLREEHGWSNAVVSGATSAYFILSGITSLLIGPHVDRRGPIPFIIAGVITIGVAVALVGVVAAVWHLFAVYALLALGYGMVSGVSINAVLTRWFVRRRALAMSISATGISLGGIILAPLGAWLVDQGGLALAAPVLGAAVVLIPLPVVWLVIVFDPRQMAMLPDGARSLEREEGAPPHRRAPSYASQVRIWTRHQAVRTVAFWAILVAFVLVLLAQTGVVIHQIAFLEDRLGSRSAASFTLSMTALGSIGARVLVGLFADAMDKRWLTAAIFAIQAASVLLVLHVESAPATFVLMMVFGFTVGTVYLLQSLLVGEIFGMLSFGTVFGLILFAGQTGSGIGPFLIGWLEQQTGGYTVALTTTSMLTLLAAVVVLFARPIPVAAASAEERGARAEAAGG